MNTISNNTIGNIVAGNFRTAKVFSNYGIDFCCGGGITLKEACKRKNIDPLEIIRDIEQVLERPDEFRYIDYNLSQLIDHIVTSHHTYVNGTIPALKTYLDKLVRVHGERHPELVEIRDQFFQAAEALKVHMEKEELVLFPYIVAMESSKSQNFTLSEPHFGHIDNPINGMEDDHEAEGERFRKIAVISNQYTPPADACQTYKLAFALLQEFDNDLHLHIHLENNILFPKAKALYQQFDF